MASRLIFSREDELISMWHNSHLYRESTGFFHNFLIDRGQESSQEEFLS